jgi:hypothetical protein
MELVNYSPEECSGEIEGCEELEAHARFAITNITQEQAIRNFLIITFTTILLFIAAVTISNDTQKIVIKPITKMVNIIKRLADDPLKLPEAPVQDEEIDFESHMKTTVLENTIFKIGNLLQVKIKSLILMINSDGIWKTRSTNHRRKYVRGWRIKCDDSRCED